MNKDGKMDDLNAYPLAPNIKISVTINSDSFIISVSRRNDPYDKLYEFYDKYIMDMIEKYKYKKYRDWYDECSYKYDDLSNEEIGEIIKRLSQLHKEYNENK